MLELLAAISLAYIVLFSVLAVVVAVVSGILYRARRAARVLETADLTEASLEEAVREDPDVEPQQFVAQAPPRTRMRATLSQLARSGRR